jgi:hypothetical protein
MMFHSFAVDTIRYGKKELHQLVQDANTPDKYRLFTRHFRAQERSCRLTHKRA